MMSACSRVAVPCGESTVMRRPSASGSLDRETSTPRMTPAASMVSTASTA